MSEPAASGARDRWDDRHARDLQVRVLAGLASIGGAVAGTHATGLDVLDVILAAGIGAGVTFVGSRARRWALSAAAGVAMVAAARNGLLFVAAIAVFGFALWLMTLSRRDRRLAAVAAAAIVQVLLRLPAWGPYGLPSLIAGVGIGLIVVSGFWHLRRHVRRRLAIAALTLAGGALLITAIFGVSAVRARSDVRAGASEARLGIDAARRGETDAAIAHFDLAQEYLSAASGRLDQPWTRVAGIVPIISQHERALRLLTDDAEDLTRTGARAARDADLDTLRVQDGTLDPDRVDAMRAPLRRVDAALQRTQRDLEEVDTGWLIGPVSKEVRRLSSKVDSAATSARTARLALEAAPDLLGETRPAKYLLMFTTPSEARGTGFMGNWGILTADHGHFDLTSFGRSTELNTGGGGQPKTISGPPDYLARYNRYGPAREWRNVTMSPDFPSVAKVARELAPQSGLPAVDGVIAVDPIGIAALLELTGPVVVPGRTEPLTADNAAEFLLRDQYFAFDVNTGRIDFLEEAARAVTDRLTSSSLPGPRRIGKVLGRATRGRHLLVYSFDPIGRRVFDRLGTTGAIAPASGGYAALVTENSGGNKIDLYLQRELRYDARIDPSSGRVAATAEITLTNSAPTTGAPQNVIGSQRSDVPAGANSTIVSFYSDLALRDATIDGRPIKLVAEKERGLHVYTTSLLIPAGASQRLQLRLEGAAPVIRREEGLTLKMTVGHQAMVNPDKVVVRMHIGDGWRLSPVRPLGAFDRATVTWDASLERRAALRARATYS